MPCKAPVGAPSIHVLHNVISTEWLIKTQGRLPWIYMEQHKPETNRASAVADMLAQRVKHT
jgi:hypothetical protein